MGYPFFCFIPQTALALEGFLLLFCIELVLKSRISKRIVPSPPVAAWLRVAWKSRIWPVAARRRLAARGLEIQDLARLGFTTA